MPRAAASRDGGGDRVSVGLRIRPLIASERSASSQLGWRWDRRSVESARVDWAALTEPELARMPDERLVRLSFDRVFGPEESTEQVYEELVRPLVERVVEGYNATVLAYGQTTSGKTHTISGAASPSVPPSPALAPALSPAGSPAGAAPAPEGKGGRAALPAARTNNENSPPNTSPNTSPSSSSSWGAADGAAAASIGVLQMSVDDLFRFVDAREGLGSSFRFVVRASYCEIHQEVLQDLVDPQRRHLTILDDPVWGPSVKGLSQHIVESASEALEILRKGQRNRHVGKTGMSEQSSRSHTLFALRVESKPRGLEELLGPFSPSRVSPALAAATGTNCTTPRDADGTGSSSTSSYRHDAAIERESAAAFQRWADDDAKPLAASSLSVIDLAGSERVSKTKASGERLREAGTINKSLAALGNVIAALNDKAPHIPFRDSKLTRLLQSAIGGNSNTAVICCLSPALLHLDESRSTLQFAQRASRIHTHATVNKLEAGDAILSAFRSQVARLERQLLLTASEKEGLEGRVRELEGRLSASLASALRTPRVSRALALAASVDRNKGPRTVPHAPLLRTPPPYISTPGSSALLRQVRFPLGVALEDGPRPREHGKQDDDGDSDGSGDEAPSRDADGKLALDGSTSPEPTASSGENPVITSDSGKAEEESESERALRAVVEDRERQLSAARDHLRVAEARLRQFIGVAREQQEQHQRRQRDLDARERSLAAERRRWEATVESAEMAAAEAAAMQQQRWRQQQQQQEREDSVKAGVAARLERLLGPGLALRAHVTKLAATEITTLCRRNCELCKETGRAAAQLHELQVALRYQEQLVREGAELRARVVTELEDRLVTAEQRCVESASVLQKARLASEAAVALRARLAASEAAHRGTLRAAERGERECEMLRRSVRALKSELSAGAEQHEAARAELHRLSLARDAARTELRRAALEETNRVARERAVLGELAERADRAAALEVALGASREERDAADRRAEACATRVDGLLAELSAAAAALRRESDRVAALEAAVAAASATAETLSAERDAACQQAESAMVHASDLEEEFAAASRHAEATTQMGRAELERVIRRAESLESDLAAALKRADALEAELGAAGQYSRSLEAKLESARELATRLEAETEASRADVRGLEGDLEHALSRVTALEAAGRTLVVQRADELKLEARLRGEAERQQLEAVQRLKALDDQRASELAAARAEAAELQSRLEQRDERHSQALRDAQRELDAERQRAQSTAAHLQTLLEQRDDERRHAQSEHDLQLQTEAAERGRLLRDAQREYDAECLRVRRALEEQHRKALRFVEEERKAERQRLGHALEEQHRQALRALQDEHEAERERLRQTPGELQAEVAKLQSVLEQRDEQHRLALAAVGAQLEATERSHSQLGASRHAELAHLQSLLERRDEQHRGVLEAETERWRSQLAAERERLLAQQQRLVEQLLRAHDAAKQEFGAAQESIERTRMLGVEDRQRWDAALVAAQAELAATRQTQAATLTELARAREDRVAALAELARARERQTTASLAAAEASEGRALAEREARQLVDRLRRTEEALAKSEVEAARAVRALEALAGRKDQARAAAAEASNRRLARRIEALERLVLGSARSPLGASDSTGASAVSSSGASLSLGASLSASNARGLGLGLGPDPAELHASSEALVVLAAQSDEIESLRAGNDLLAAQLADRDSQLGLAVALFEDMETDFRALLALAEESAATNEARAARLAQVNAATARVLAWHRRRKELRQSRHRRGRQHDLRIERGDELGADNEQVCARPHVALLQENDYTNGSDQICR